MRLTSQHQPLGSIKLMLISGFHSLKRPEVLPTPPPPPHQTPECDSGPYQDNSSITGSPGTHLGTWVERRTVRVKCFAQEPLARGQTRSAHSAGQCTNHRAFLITTFFLTVHHRTECKSRARLGRTSKKSPAKKKCVKNTLKTIHCASCLCRGTVLRTL